LLESHELDAIDDEVAKLIADAVATARAAAVPDSAALLSDVYVSY
jgi:pyruvate dehydrogenase E1 component alpha subunit